ncbi:MAG: hypothetical protein UW73_C0025G0009 [Microgenomates group bacterium GW2011_GWB1_44_8]|nr:MAG: hypothetical protein UW73_C0025G0009 [Microgenomates group bacterium GW2011_GWB1_44_8]
MLSVDLIKADLMAAMKSGDSLKVSVLRMLSSEFNYKAIEVQRELTREDILAVLNKEAKKRREAIESFEKAGRPEQVEKEKKELEILSAYLPTLMSEDEIKAEIAKLDLPKDFGQAMRVAAPVFKGKADGSLVAKLVNEKISQS